MNAIPIARIVYENSDKDITKCFGLWENLPKKPILLKQKQLRLES